MFTERIIAELSELEGKRLVRSIRTRSGSGQTKSDNLTPIINFSSNDYLGLARHPQVIEAAAEALARYGTSASSSRVVTGALPPHAQLEAALRGLLGMSSDDQVLLFGSGALTNLGIFSALVGRHDLIVADRLVHATIIDGAKLSGARLERFAHNDVSDLENILRSERAARPHSSILVVTESVFSMDGDLAPLSEIISLCERYEALSVVDEAHALGVFGPVGDGLLAERGLRDRVSITIGTLGKSFAAYGGFVASSGPIIKLLTSRARTFLYSTALPPTVAAAAVAAIELVREDGSLGKRLLGLSAGFTEQLKVQLKEQLKELLPQIEPVIIGKSQSQIIPIVIGDNAQALQIAECLESRGVIATAIRPPTVPVGTARLRLSVSLMHDQEMLMRGAEEIANVIGEVRS